jgi:hypothetical protein
LQSRIHPEKSIKTLRAYFGVTLVVAVMLTAGAAQAWTPLPVSEDPLVRFPGTQPEQGVNLEGPGRCLNCHEGYNPQVEPGFNWKGSMMAQAARDPIFWACLTVAAQDSIWALGNPNAVDICERCHFPEGWLAGRSEPVNASSMTGSDYDGLHCDFCHTMYDPFFEDTFNTGDREMPVADPDFSAYWDESTSLSQTEAAKTYSEDLLLSGGYTSFSGGAFFLNNYPKYYPSYTESTSSQFFVSSGSEKRASFADPEARHKVLYSRFHKSKFFCGTCHDVSNPALANLGLSGLAAQTDPATGQPSTDLVTEQYSAANYFHVERTFSEFMLSAYGQVGGAPTNAEFQAQGAPDITNAAKCQDCHMRDVVGVGCNKKGVPIRPDQSDEHPASGLPLHDLTGGNAWTSHILASLDPDGPVYDPRNVEILDKGPAILTLDLNAGETPKQNGAALEAGSNRAKQQLLLAATILDLSYSPGSGAISFKVQNNSGHKLISGFPEGRRMFLNIKAYDSSDSLIHEVNPYDFDAVTMTGAGTLKGLSRSPNSPALGPNEAYADELVYEVHPSSSLTGEDETFHFVLATGRYKDNRIPPKGFDIAGAAARLSEPVWHGVEDPAYFTSAEYAGGYDDVSLTIAPGAERVEVALYYQGTSREYIEFLRDEINGTGNLTLYGPDNQLTTPDGTTHTQTFAQEVGWNPDADNAYLIQDPAQTHFAQLRPWGDTIWDLWFHNHGLDGLGKIAAGIVPFRMATATWGTAPQPCGAPTPTLQSAVPSSGQVAVTWSDEHTADPAIVGYRLYYDQAGKAQFLANVGLVTTYANTGLTNGQEYCYEVTSLYADCESAYSAVLCAIPNAGGQIDTGADSVTTGKWVTTTTGKGKNKVTITEFVETSTFATGDVVVVRAHVIDISSGLDLGNATVDITLDGPDADMPMTLTTVSDGDGIAEVTWETSAPNKRGRGGTTPGSYTATTTDVTAGGYSWDDVATSASFTIE